MNARRDTRVLVFSLATILSLLIWNLSEAHNEEINDLTTQLLQTAALYQRAPAAEKSGHLEKSLGLAATRKALMLQKIESDPATFLLHSLPAEVRNSLPALVQGLVEESIEVSGELTVVRADDFEHGRFETTYSLTTDETPSKTFSLHFASDPTTLMTGSKIRVKGMALGPHIGLASGGAPRVQTQSAAITSLLGTQQTIVIVGNFLDSAVPCAPADIYVRMFTDPHSINNYYQETSFNQVSFSGDVYGPYTINYYSNSTDYMGWANALDQAVTGAGVNLGNYSRRVYVLPPNATGYAGYGLYGGSPSRAWIYRCDWSDLYAHELGHNFGMRHASTPTLEYGDYSCVMGYSNVGLRHLNAPHKVQTGWVPSSRVQTVTSSGAYQLSLLEQTNGSSIQVIKIPKSDTSEYYYLGYRRPVGFDGTGLRSDYWQTTDVHTWNGSLNTYLVGVLGDGASFSDSINGISVTQTGHDDTAGTATVSIIYTGPSCAPGAPAVAVSPSSLSGSAGTNLGYSVSITDNDSSVCGNVTFAFTAVVPTGWTSAFLLSPLQLAPGSTGSTTWTVTAPEGTTDGSYPIQVIVTDVSNSSHLASTNATAVLMTDTTPPTVSFISPANGSSVPPNGQVKINVSAFDNVGVTQVEIRIDGALKATMTSSPYTTTWNAKREAKGPHTIQATAYDAAGKNASASVTVYR